MSDATPRKMIILGDSIDDDGHTIQAGIPMADWTTHALVVGTTGSGKSLTMVWKFNSASRRPWLISG